ncbi:DUF397 domain-containing protein [Polymorphospora sp. NPDC050346]|uniref:DUF397 domain-containing protein n=1 Tax=Polymorphospora sp. NPDC050346 TaxID=3155780 RepID=UPI0033EA9FB1
MSQGMLAIGSWRKSSRCESHNCLEVAHRGGEVAVRNNSVPMDQITFAESVWADFVAGVRAGAFDLR